MTMPVIAGANGQQKKNISLTAEMNAAHCSDVYSSQNECETTLVPKVIAPEHDPGMHITPYAGQLS